MSKSWTLTWTSKREWDLGDVEVKPCKKKDEFYDSELPTILYKAPYKYHLRVKGNVRGAKINPLFKLVYSDTGKDVNGKTFEITNKKTSVHQSNNGSKKPIIEKMVSFSLCSYKHGGRSFKMIVQFWDQKGNVCFFMSTPFVVKAKKPIANPGIKSSGKRKRSRTKSPNKPRRKKSKSPSLKPKKKKRRTNSYRPKPGDNRKITLRSETERKMMRVAPSYNSPIETNEKRTFPTRKRKKKSPPVHTRKKKTFNVRLETQQRLQEESDKYHEAYAQGFPLEKKEDQNLMSNSSKVNGLLGGSSNAQQNFVSGFEQPFPPNMMMYQNMMMGGFPIFGDDFNGEDEDDDDDEENETSMMMGNSNNVTMVPTVQTVQSTTVVSSSNFPMFSNAYQAHYEQHHAHHHHNVAPPPPMNYGYPVITTTRHEIIQPMIPSPRNHQQYCPPPPPPILVPVNCQKFVNNNIGNGNMKMSVMNKPQYSHQLRQQAKRTNNTDHLYGKNRKKKKSVVDDANFCAQSDDLISLLDPHSDIDIANYQVFDDFGPIKDIEEENRQYFQK